MTHPAHVTLPRDLKDAIAFMDQAAAMLGRGEMPAPATDYAAKWYRAHSVVNAAARQALPSAPQGGGDDQFGDALIDLLFRHGLKVALDLSEIERLRSIAALQAPGEAGEPVAWRWKDDDGDWAASAFAETAKCVQKSGRAVWPLYSHPPADRAIDPRLIEWGYTSTDEAITHLGKLLDDQAAFDGLGEGWRPIESAPKDGTPILAWCVHHYARYATDGKDWAAPVVTQWINHNGGGWTWNGMAGAFTHWRPLPAPPAPEGA